MKLLVLKCNNRNHRSIIKHFRKVVEKQQEDSISAIEEVPYEIRAEKNLSADFVLEPWGYKCKDDYVFIAYEGTKKHIILGWMQVSLKKFSYSRYDPLRIAHVNYISTNQNRAGEGIGRNMMTEMERIMKDQEDCDFVELMPLSGVIGFYTKLGYALEFVKVNYYTKWLKGTKAASVRTLEKYYEELKIKDQQLSEVMEADEQEAFQPIYNQFTREEKEIYLAMQHDDDSTRIGMIITYDESGEDMDEVRKMLM